MADPGETIAAPMGSIGTDRIVFIRIVFPVRDDYVHPQHPLRTCEDFC
ncbi:hypothetical protein [Novosphingobium lindaniclasticum]|uniref:Uncharacterized protein n=1 Tax=Novosphingobium lindaniclasticum LE124 TaxID=1096930 RepID=T0IFK7_9SPHN|nr:hypothetical protein [Novosphingobium lindaniclasticum]EQB10480.1 hypothetical protein L284_16700 [Novosphingobium lindaniclasticum LE124]